jgi:hypothetical protein
MVQSVCTSAPREEERAASHERGVRGYARMYSRSQNLFPVCHWRIDRVIEHTIAHPPSSIEDDDEFSKDARSGCKLQDKGRVTYLED